MGRTLRSAPASGPAPQGDRIAPMPWFKITLTDNDILSLKGMELQEEFARLFAAAGAPQGTALFSAHEGGLHEYYFSPSAAAIARAMIRRYAGVECPAPAESSVSLLVGSPEVPFGGS